MHTHFTGLSSSTTITTSVPTPTKQSSISTQESPLVGFRKLNFGEEWRKENAIAHAHLRFKGLNYI